MSDPFDHEFAARKDSLLREVCERIGLGQSTPFQFHILWQLLDALSITDEGKYNLDPDGYAARYFGFTNVNDYQEWLALDGASLCGALTTDSKQCRNAVFTEQDASHWRILHRQVLCHVHRGGLL